MKKELIFLLLFLPVFILNGQKPLGTWTSYLPYNSAHHLTIAENKIYCVTEGGLFYYNKEDHSLNKFSKEDGLSDTEISVINFSEESQTLVIAYQNANLDLIMGNEIFNLPDIKRKQILGDKNIYGIHFKDSLAYLACGFGIVVIDLTRTEIKETYYIGPGGSSLKINGITTFKNAIYAATENGLYTADLSNPNLIDFNNWNRVEEIADPFTEINALVSTESYLFLHHKNAGGNADRIYWFDGISWTEYPYLSEQVIRSFNVWGENLIVCSYFELDVISPDGTIVKHYFIGRPLYSGVDEEGTAWVADEDKGLIRIPEGGDLETINPDGPSSIDVAAIEVLNNKLVAVAGGRTSSWNNLYRNARVYSYDQKNWYNWRADSLKDLVRIAIDPVDTSHFFVSSWGYGLLEFRNNELVHLYRRDNSTLQSVLPNDIYIRLGGISFDRNRNLWLTNSEVTNSLSVLTPEGDWHGFDIAGKVNTQNLGDLVITPEGHKWIILQGGSGLFVYDDKGTFENLQDDEYLKLSVKDRNNKVITNDVYSIALDRSNNLWLGTSKGIVVYYSPSRIFSDDEVYAQQIIVPRNDGSGLGDPLLGTETVSAIAVDGADRKWLGTRSGGVFLVSDDGLEEIQAFNTDNSPLLSNSITDIAINEKSGEVFFATSRGIISYMSNATAPSGVFSDVYVYPNPVREDYHGDIVVRGLIEETWVKITDLNGNLVFETKSLGGQAIWDGNNLLGERVATGIYLIFCTNEDGSQTHVNKLMFIH